ncbi:MAG: Periplasmic copper-binding protein (NosD) [Methanomassiliicoccales archaeon PtaU1.Bin124]|nr:MAG: Periplasmic copper-binding protein (NosD) [Methanomassiliicoccales archaeon PtaU1.Bin124]
MDSQRSSAKAVGSKIISFFFAASFIFSAIGIALPGIALAGEGTIDDGSPSDAPILGYTNSQPLIIDDDAELAAASSSGSGTSSDPYVITGLSIDAAGGYKGIYLGNITKHVVVHDCLIRNVGLLYSFISDMTGSGVAIYRTANDVVTIRNNIIQDSARGINVYESNGVTISENTITNCNLVGILLATVDGCSLFRNDVSGSFNWGILVYGTANRDEESTNVKIMQNKVHDNGGDGISLANADFTLIHGNMISDNDGLAINIANNGVRCSDGTMVYANSFWRNSGSTSAYDVNHVQVSDSGNSSKYNVNVNGELNGNYWYDLSEYDLSPNGSLSVDVPIAGTGMFYDRNPSGIPVNHLPFQIAGEDGEASFLSIIDIDGIYGSGTVADPYVLKDLWINAQGGRFGIYFNGSANWAIPANITLDSAKVSYVQDDTGGYDGSGIYINDTGRVAVSDIDNRIRLVGCEATRNLYGIKLDDVTGVNVTDCVANANNITGIYGKDLLSTAIENNQCQYNGGWNVTGYGMFFIYVTQPTLISGNNCSYNHGLRMDGTTGTAYAYGIYAIYCSGLTLKDNQVWGNYALGNYSVPNSYLHTYAVGIHIGYSTSCLLIGNVVATQSARQTYSGGGYAYVYGISTAESSLITMENNRIFENSAHDSIFNMAYAMRIFYTDDAVVRNNVISRNNGFDAKKTNVTNAKGLYVFGSHNGLYSHNLVENNYQHGASSGSSYGFDLLYSNNNLLVANVVKNNNETGAGNGYGISSYQSDNNRFYHNVITGHVSLGLWFTTGSDGNYVVYNEFYLNCGSTSSFTAGKAQAADETGTNHWYVDYRGNYWFDWTSPDNDHNGIIDSPYVMDSDPVTDPFPLADPSVLAPFRIDSDAELIDMAESSGWTGTGTASDPIVISNCTISAGGDSAAIYIGNTTLHIIIRDCQLTAADQYWTSLYHSAAGLILLGVQDVDVLDCTITGNSRSGISLMSASFIRIDGCTISGNGQMGADTNMYGYGIKALYGTNVAISNNTITGNGPVPDDPAHTSNLGTGVMVSDAHDYSIENNVISGTVGYNAYGINMDFVSSSSVKGNTIIENGFSGANSAGLYLTSSDSLKITGNDIRGNGNLSTNGIGIWMETTTVSEISHNAISFHDGNGAYLASNSNMNTLTENEFSQNLKFGVSVASSQENVIYGNTFLSNHGSTATYDTNHVQAYDNSAVGNSWCGTMGNYWSDLTGPDADQNLRADGGYPIPSSPLNVKDLNPTILPFGWISITGDADLLVQATERGWVGDGSEANPILIEGLALNGYFSPGAVLTMTGTTLHTVIQNNLLAFAKSAAHSQILTVSTQNIIVSGNVLRYANYGLVDQMSSGIIISNNNINDTWQTGIVLIGSIGAEVRANTITGTVVTATASGIAVMSAHDCLVFSNVLDDNKYGIRGEISAYANKFYQNSISGSTQVALFFDSTTHTNQVFQNWLKDNGDGTHQAMDDSALNAWSNDRVGNYWYGQVTPDANGDDIVDAAIPISGVGGASDMFPLASMVSRPVSLSASMAGDKVQLSWTASNYSVLDSHVMYRVYRSVDGGLFSLRTVTTDLSILEDYVAGAANIRYQVEAATSYGTSARSRTVSMNDAEAPVVQITSPAEGSTITTSNLLVEWHAWDNQSGLTNMNVRIDGGDWVPKYLQTSHIFSGLSQGHHKVEVMAIDGIFLSTIASANFTVELPPVLHIIAPAASSTFGVDSLTVRWEGWANQSGIDHYEIKVDGGAWTSVSTAVSYQLTDLTEGQHTIYVKAVSGISIETIASVAFTLADDPWVSITSPKGVINTTMVNIVWNGGDNLSSIAYYLVKLDTGVWTNVSTATSYTVFATEGDHNIYVKAVDAVGHEAMAQSTFTLDSTAPSVTSYSPNGVVTSLNPTISIVFSELMNQSSVVVTISGVGVNKVWSGTTLTITLAAPLTAGASYTVMVNGKDLAGNAMMPVQWSISTGAGQCFVQGHVQGTDGQPISGATVTCTGGQSAQTDVNGNYSFELPPGSYTISITKTGYEPIEIQVELSPGEIESVVRTMTSTSASGNNGSDGTMMIVAIVGIAAVAGAGGFLYLRSRKK